MDRGCYEEEETYLPSKRIKACDEAGNKKDLISELPDPILVHILSFLPLRDAIKTALLPRFGKLWLSLPVLDLDNCGYHEDDEEAGICYTENLMAIIRQIRNHNDNRNKTLDKLHLKFWFPPTFSYSMTESDFDDDDPFFDEIKGWDLRYTTVDTDQIVKLLRYAINRKLKVLDLNFLGCGNVPPVQHLYKLPGVFTSNYLTELRLAVCDFRSCGKISLPALRVLYLHEVYLSDEAMESILSGCPFLEDLSVVYCGGLGKLSSENPKLKNLMLTLHNWTGRVIVSCPHVVSIEISGWIERLTLVDVSSLVDAKICFSAGIRCEQRVYAKVQSLIAKVRQCNNFKPCCWTILVMSIWKLKNIICPEYAWKHITIELPLTRWHLPGLCFLLQHCSSLETLTLRVSYVDDEAFFFPTREANWIWEHDFDGEKYWDPQEAFFPCLESIVIFSHHMSQPYVIEMIKFLLKNAPKLQKVVISTEKRLELSVDKGDNDVFTSEELLELLQELRMFPRASSGAMIYLS